MFDFVAFFSSLFPLDVFLVFILLLQCVPVHEADGDGENNSFTSSPILVLSTHSFMQFL